MKPKWSTDGPAKLRPKPKPKPKAKAKSKVVLLFLRLNQMLGARISRISIFLTHHQAALLVSPGSASLPLARHWHWHCHWPLALRLGYLDMSSNFQVVHSSTRTILNSYNSQLVQSSTRTILNSYNPQVVPGQLVQYLVILLLPGAPLIYRLL